MATVRRTAVPPREWSPRYCGPRGDRRTAACEDICHRAIYHRVHNGRCAMWRMSSLQALIFIAAVVVTGAGAFAYPWLQLPTETHNHLSAAFRRRNACGGACASRCSLRAALGHLRSMEDRDYLPLNICANSDAPASGLPPPWSNGISARRSRSSALAYGGICVTSPGCYRE